MKRSVAFLIVVASLFGAAPGQLLAAVGTVPKILVFGDSLSAGYGIDPRVGWVALLVNKLASQGYEYQVVNASVSGETTAGGRARLNHALQLHHPAILVLELGANDGLRGLPIPQMRENLSMMINAASQAGARVLLVGMQIPPNYGAEYAARFRETFEQLSRQPKLRFAPFLLEGVALDTALVQADGLHPTTAAQPRLLENVWQALQPLLDKNS
jgi:acyl-CoA thioesterase-1